MSNVQLAVSLIALLFASGAAIGLILTYRSFND